MQNNESTTILGIDPGYDRVGIAVINKLQKGREEVIYSDCFQTSSKDTIYDRLLSIGIEVARIIDTYSPDSLSIESLFITKNQKTAMRVSEARGIIIYQAISKGVPVSEYSPMQVKMSITGDGTSDKSRIQKMVKLLVKLPKKDTLDDEYDALAVALTHSAIMKSKQWTFI
ncbi:MAG: crossover junction endodeoxyribonuclease RuvC [Candidatus Taylorbacteria bacterium]